MNTLSLATRNLFRNSRRTLMAWGVIVVGVVALILFGGYTLSIRYGLETGIVRAGGQLQIQRQGYFLYGSGDPLSYGLRNYPAMIAKLAADPEIAAHVTVITPVLAVQGIAGNFAEGASRTVSGAGVVVDDQNGLRQWNDYQVSDHASRLALTDTSPDSVVIGTGVARVLHVCTDAQPKLCTTSHQKKADLEGQPATPADIARLSQLEAPAGAPVNTRDRLQLLAANAYGAPNVAALKVVHIEKKAVKDLDDIFVQLHLAQAQRLIYGNAPPEVTSIVIQLKHTEDIPQVRRRIAQLLTPEFSSDPLEVLDYKQLNSQFGQAMRMFDALFAFVALLIGLITLFTVGNAMNMAVMERVVEIGTLRAMGVRRVQILRMFVLEGFLIGVGGALAGIALALVAAALINRAGLHWEPPGETEPVSLFLRVWGEIAMFVRISAVVLAVAVISSLWPAFRASRLKIVDALHFA